MKKTHLYDCWKKHLRPEHFKICEEFEFEGSNEGFMCFPQLQPRHGKAVWCDPVSTMTETL